MSDESDHSQTAFCDSLTIRNTAQVKEALMEKFRESDEVYLDLAAEAPVDFSAIQLIDSARRYAIARGKRFCLTRPADGPLGTLLEQGGFLNDGSTDGGAFWRGEAA